MALELAVRRLPRPSAQRSDRHRSRPQTPPQARPGRKRQDQSIAQSHPRAASPGVGFSAPMNGRNPRVSAVAPSRAFPRNITTTAAIAAGSCVPSDAYTSSLANQPRKGGRPNIETAASAGTDEADRQMIPETAKGGHITRPGAMVDDAGDEKQAGLVERVSDEVGGDGERRRGIAEAEQHDHQPERGDGRLGEDLLEVGLLQRRDRTPEQRRAADGAQHTLPERRSTEQRAEARQQVNSGLHHGRGV